MMLRTPLGCNESTELQDRRDVQPLAVTPSRSDSLQTLMLRFTSIFNLDIITNYNVMNSASLVETLTTC